MAEPKAQPINWRTPGDGLAPDLIGNLRAGRIFGRWGQVVVIDWACSS